MTSLVLHIPLKDVKRSGEFVAGGDLRKKRNQWFKTAFMTARSGCSS